MLSNKTKIVLLKGSGGRIWISEKEAQLIKSAINSSMPLVSLEDQMIATDQIKGVVNSDTYQTTRERQAEREQKSEYPQEANKSTCNRCYGHRFILENRKSDLYGPAAVPCSWCNVNPPKLSW